MIPHTLTAKQEQTLRIEYVNDPAYLISDWDGYRKFAIANVSGVIEASYRGGDDVNYIDALLFESEEHLSWFMLKYS